MQEFNPFNHLGFLTTRVSRLIHRRIEANMPFYNLGFPPSYLGIIADLSQKDGITQKELGSSLIKTKSSIAKMLKVLSEKELIIKKDHPTDKRNKLIFLTDKGRQLISTIESKGLIEEAKLLNNTSAAEIQITKKVLKELYLNLSENLYNNNKDD